MVSRRTFFIISMMMAVLFFLFVFSGVVKEQLNEYDTNQYAKESELTKEDEWKAEKNKAADVVLVGCDRESAVYNTVSSWCTYTKRKLAVYKNLGEYKLPEENKPEFLMIDSDGINFDKETDALYNIANNSVNIIFCNLPEVSVIENNSKLSDILGVVAINVDSIHIEGVKLFSGFLLGGESIYKVDEDETDEDVINSQDFELDIPWFQTKSGTKTYMVGMMDEDKIDNEYMPGIIWRNSIGESVVFAVNGNYMSRTVGIGILSAMASESKEYDIYPIVNAQNLTLANFPSFSLENNDKMMEMYSRSQPAVFKELVWSNVASTIEKNHNKMTCLFALQYDYSDSEEPLASEYVYYLKLLNESGAEAGLSTARKGSISLDEKLGRDRLYLVEQSNKYQFCAFYAQYKDITETAKLSGTVNAEDMSTITTDFNDGKTLFDYVADDVTLQMATIDGYNHTFQDDFRVKSLETALGYSNILVDMKRISWPENEDEDRWELLAEDFSKYTNTYWQAFTDFEQTTLSESDRRIRKLLSLDYSSTREDDTIKLKIENVKDTTWFILRTHGEEIESISGGDYTKLETDAYLIRADKSELEIKLKNTFNDSYFYLN